MTDDMERDPLMRMLAGLPTLRPSAGRDRRITARCHSALARGQRVRPERERLERPERLERLERLERFERFERLANAALAVLLCGYAAVAVVQALRLAVVL